MPRGRAGGGEEDGEPGGAAADGGGGGHGVFEVGAEDAFEGEGAALAEGTVVLESARAGCVDRRDVVPDAREVPAAGGVEELPVGLRLGLCEVAARRDAGAAEQPRPVAEQGEVATVAARDGTGENRFDRSRGQNGQTDRKGVARVW